MGCLQVWSSWTHTPSSRARSSTACAVPLAVEAKRKLKSGWTQTLCSWPCFCLASAIWSLPCLINPLIAISGVFCLEVCLSVAHPHLFCLKAERARPPDSFLPQLVFCSVSGTSGGTAARAQAQIFDQSVVKDTLSEYNLAFRDCRLGVRGAGISLARAYYPSVLPKDSTEADDGNVWFIPPKSVALEALQKTQGRLFQDPPVDPDAFDQAGIFAVFI